MITIKNTENYLKEQLAGASEMHKVWEVFKSFCRFAVEGEEEPEILFECGVYDFTGEDLFHFSFVRQFSIYDEDEYSHMEQLHCEFLFQPTEELSSLEAVEWSMDYEQLDEFFSSVENLEEFKIPLTLKPIKFELYQEEI